MRVIVLLYDDVNHNFKCDLFVIGCNLNGIGVNLKDNFGGYNDIHWDKIV